MSSTWPELRATTVRIPELQWCFDMSPIGTMRGKSGRCSVTAATLAGMEAPVGARISVGGGYDFEPPWLSGSDHFVGNVFKWIAGQNDRRACVVQLDDAITATGDVRGRRERRTGRLLILQLRYVGQERQDEGTVHVELCDAEPADV